jgi:ATP-dependent Lon protease
MGSAKWSAQNRNCNSILILKFINKIDIESISARQAALDRAAIFLKEQFVGIDEVIDSLLEYIQIWYLGPELLTRPIIVNLWGVTGVGKTDLVRKLVKFLDMQDRFAEVELSNVDSPTWPKNVAKIALQLCLIYGLMLSERR